MTHPPRLAARKTIELFPIGLGAMPMSLTGRPDEETARRVIKSFVDGGGNFIDTANVYCCNESEIGHNEALVFRALQALGINEMYVATKGGLRMQGDSWVVDASPAWLRMSCESSLCSLNTHCIFLYQLHAPDPDIDLLESVGELMRMQSEGMIQHIGLSNVSRKQLRRVVEMTQILSVQNRCNIKHREDRDQGLIEMCRDNGILYIAHSPVGGHYHHAELMGHPVLCQIANKHDTTAYVIALAWLLHQGNNVLPIPGASKVQSVESSLGAGEIELDEEDVREIEGI